MSKYIFITGINGNLAKRILSYLSIRSEYKFVGCDIHSEYDDRTRESIDMGLDFYLECDIRCENSIKSTIDILRERNIFPSVLINNAAVDSIPVKNDRMTGLEMNNFSDIINVNLKAPILFSKYCSEYWIQNGIKGNIINISSIYSIVSPDPNIYTDGFIKNILYGATKAALNNVTSQMAVIFIKFGIRVNALLLAGIYSEKQDEVFQKNYVSRIPIGRFLEVHEIFDSLDLLLSEKNTYMTGTIIKIDGGYTSI
jgi:NAD(P)-dependent dehydrogenase (short-subunit alcohol dehydrogenase family)